MAENKTKPTKVKASSFLASIENTTRRQDAIALNKMMQDITGEKPVMWGPSIIGFGQTRYRYESGREGDMLRLGFSPRKANLALYLGHDKKLLEKLGKHKLSVACLYINKLADVDIDVLKSLIAKSWNTSSKKTACH